MIAAGLEYACSPSVKRETADVYFRFKKLLAGSKDYSKVNVKAEWSSKQTAPDTLYRYPSLYRSACSPSGPVNTWRDFRTNSRVTTSAIGYQPFPTRICRTGRAIGAWTQSTTIGREQCKRFRSFLRQWQYSVWQVALTTMWSAASRVRAQGLSRQNYWALIRQAACLSVPQQVSSATTQVSATNLRITTPAGVQHPRTVVGAFAPSAVFCFGDERPCSRKS